MGTGGVTAWAAVAATGAATAAAACALSIARVSPKLTEVKCDPANRGGGAIAPTQMSAVNTSRLIANASTIAPTRLRSDWR